MDQGPVRMTAEWISQDDVWSLFMRGSAKLILEQDTQGRRCCRIRKGGTKRSIRLLECEEISGIVESSLCVCRFVN